MAPFDPLYLGNRTSYIKTVDTILKGITNAKLEAEVSLYRSPDLSTPTEC